MDESRGPVDDSHLPPRHLVVDNHHVPPPPRHLMLDDPTQQRHLQAGGDTTGVSHQYSPQLTPEDTTAPSLPPHHTGQHPQHHHHPQHPPHSQQQQQQQQQTPQRTLVPESPPEVTRPIIGNGDTGNTNTGRGGQQYLRLSQEDINAITEAGSKGGTFTCTLCQKKFGYKNGLIRHVRLTHVGEKPYQCNICQRRFGYKHILMEHQNLHFGNRPYACTLCDKRFAARSNLIQHRMVHKRPFNCSMCNKRFDREDQLKKHLFAHPQALLTCNFCTYAAAAQSDLNKHMVEHHPPQVMETRAPPTRRESGENGEGCADEDSAGEELGGRSSSAEQHTPEMTSPVTPGSGSLLCPPSLTSPGTPAAIAAQNALNYALRVTANDQTGGRGQRVESICNQLINLSGTPVSAATQGPHGQQGQHGQQPPPEVPFHGVIVKKEAEEMDTCSVGSGEHGSHALPSPRTPVNHNHSNDSLNYSTHAQFSLPPGGESGRNTAPSFFGTPPPLPHSASSSSGHLDFSLSRTNPIYTNVLVGGPNNASGGLNNIGLPSQSKDSKLHTLPGIHEVFSRRNQRVPPTFTSYGLPTLLSSDPTARLAPMSASVSAHGAGTTATTTTTGNGTGPPSVDLPPHLLSSPPSTPTPTSFNNSNNNTSTPAAPGTATTVPATAPVSALSTTTCATRPTAQLPPITQVLRPSKDVAIQHTAPIPGFPSLDDVLAYYQGQGRLFRCQHCNILFFERGMYFLHASLHGPSSPWECSICHKVCSDKNEFTLHFVNQQHNSV